MPVKGALEKYRVEPGTEVDLRKIDSDERELFLQGGKEESIEAFDRLQDELKIQQRVLYAENKQRLLVVIQAMDTGGKDGCIRSVFSRIDPQGVYVRSFKKPSEEELARDFLWRVHHQVPRNGQMVIFNRSHYEDVVAVKVKKLFEDGVWKRRFRHIVEFERMLAEEGTTIIKIFLHISKQEQKNRLQSRLNNPDKHWKFNPDDLKDRVLWDDFMETYGEVFSKTSTDHAPWYIVLDTLKSLDMKFPEVYWDANSVSLED